MVTTKRGFMRFLPFLLALVIALLASGCSSVTVQVKNDTGAYVRIAHCVDDSADVDPGDTFDAGGVTDHGELLCVVSRNEENGRCMAIADASSIHGTFLLSHAMRVARSRCE
jgi:uncharacterized protein YceK